MVQPKQHLVSYVTLKYQISTRLNSVLYISMLSYSLFIKKKLCRGEVFLRVLTCIVKKTNVMGLVNFK